MTDLLSKERLNEIASWLEKYSAGDYVTVRVGEAAELARGALQRRETAATVALDELADDSGYNDCYIDGWNACRDAMLQSGKPLDNKRDTTRYVIVWNEGKTEGVIFNREQQSDDDVMNDVACAGGGFYFSPYSSLAESFRDNYGHGECTCQLIEIDTSDGKLTNISKDGKYDDDDGDYDV